jgi:hypothetical protein
VQAGYVRAPLDKVAFFSHRAGLPARLPRDRRPRLESRDSVRGLVQRLRRQARGAAPNPLRLRRAVGQAAPTARHAIANRIEGKTTGSRTTASRRSSTIRPCSTPTSSSSRGSAASSRSAGLRTTSRSTTTSISTRASSARCPAR